MRWIFFTTIIALYAGANIYLFIRGLHSLPAGLWRIVFSGVFIILALAFFSGMIFSEAFPVRVTSVIQHAGGMWLISLIYFIPIVLIIDIVRLINKIFPFFPSFLTLNPQLTKIGTFGFVVGLVAIIMVYGIINFNHPSIKTLDIKTSKRLRDVPKIVVASDLHLGYTLGRKKLDDFINLINSQKPEIVLLCGDIFDRSVRPIEQWNMIEELRKIHAPLGVYAVPGNHEYFGDQEKVFDLWKQAGFVVLRDSVAQPTDDIYIVGRDDRTNQRRKSLSQIMSNIDHSRLIILLDHQPFHLEEAMEAGVDFQFSGHTHDGQVWPVGLIANRIYEKSYGYFKKGDTQYYITSGLGLWGPHLRIGTNSEIVVVDNYSN
ncbi:MAG: metallophosphoesterase [Prevotellaceae bacterium]|jgi:predicted MPP superfamily phosphohydrolase|nr:metallophosphoesterase [Prevotellaceae bacterium]